MREKFDRPYRVTQNPCPIIDHLLWPICMERTRIWDSIYLCLMCLNIWFRLTDFWKQLCFVELQNVSRKRYKWYWYLSQPDWTNMLHIVLYLAKIHIYLCINHFAHIYKIYMWHDDIYIYILYVCKMMNSLTYTLNMKKRLKYNFMLLFCHFFFIMSISFTFNCKL